MSAEPMKCIDMTQALRDVAAFTHKASPERRIALLAWAESFLEVASPFQRKAYREAIKALNAAIDERNARKCDSCGATNPAQCECSDNREDDGRSAP